MQDSDYTLEQRVGPGPLERRWTSRLHYRIFRSWPQAVVDERLARFAGRPISQNVKVIMRDVYERAGQPVPPEYR